MATNNLTASVRTETGKGASRRARREGRVPAVLYGHGTEPRHLELDGHDFAAVLRNAGTNARAGARPRSGPCSREIRRKLAPLRACAACDVARRVFAACGSPAAQIRLSSSAATH